MKSKLKSKKSIENEEIGGLISNLKKSQQVNLIQRRKTTTKKETVMAHDSVGSKESSDNESGEEELYEMPEAERVAQELEQEFIRRLEELQDVNNLEEDERLMRMLGITKEQMARRKQLEEDKMFHLLCPDGVTMQDRRSFKARTRGFLDYFYDDFIVKSVAVPGTEAPDLFKDTVHMKEINKYLEMITLTISG